MTTEPTPLDLDAIKARRELVDETTGSFATLSERLYASLADIPALIAEIERLREAR